jgi:hypothetical protein
MAKCHFTYFSLFFPCLVFQFLKKSSGSIGLFFQIKQSVGHKVHVMSIEGTEWGGRDGTSSGWKEFGVPSAKWIEDRLLVRLLLNHFPSQPFALFNKFSISDSYLCVLPGYSTFEISLYAGW